MLRGHELLMLGKFVGTATTPAIEKRAAKQWAEQVSADAEVIVADEVFAGLEEYQACDEKALYALPCSRAPFICSIVEYKVNSAIEVVVVCHEEKNSEMLRAAIDVRLLNLTMTDDQRRSAESADLVLVGTVIVHSGSSSLLFAIGEFYIFMHTDGKILLATSAIYPDGAGLVQDAARELVLWSRYTVLYTFNLANCKNTILEVRKRPAGQARSLRKKYGLAETKYRVVTLAEATKRTLVEAEKSIPGLSAALHICRGHFKDYRDPQTKPLFGKHRGIWWWGQHVRGEADAGIIEKTYKAEGAER